MDLITARQYAESTGRPERTVRGWVDYARKTTEKPPEGVAQIAGAWVATRATWDGIAAQKGKQGRRDREPRVKKAVPGDTPQ